MKKPLPDSVDANRLGCSCPAYKSGDGAQRGDGVLKDGVREWVVDPRCRIHSNPRWWYSERPANI